jgi:hypothetical protein
VYLWTQHDNGADKWEKDICANTKALVKRVKIPALRAEFDLNDWTREGATADDLVNAMANVEVVQESPRPLIEFKSPLPTKELHTSARPYAHWRLSPCARLGVRNRWRAWSW